jgi:hypothetical protein
MFFLLILLIIKVLRQIIFPCISLRTNHMGKIDGTKFIAFSKPAYNISYAKPILINNKSDVVILVLNETGL